MTLDFARHPHGGRGPERYSPFNSTILFMESESEMRLKAQTRSMLALLILWLASALSGQTQAAVPKPEAAIQAVATISATVADMDRSLDFYTKVLSFHKTSDRELELRASGKAGQARRARIVSLRLGDESIELVQVRNITGRPLPSDSRSNDLWFQHIAIIVSNMDRAYRVLTSNHVKAASVAPQRLPDWNQNAAGIRAFYFKDPDGHPLEILQFPEGKGDPKWHRKPGGLFLGIDHTAIVVSSTEASLKFYRDGLGMRVVASGENYGPEQEALNHVAGAHLQITTLRATRGPGIELLEYLQPRDGRRLPYEPALSDLGHRQTVVVAHAPAQVANALPPTWPRRAYIAGQNALAVRDPDGHELLIRSADSATMIGEVK